MSSAQQVITTDIKEYLSKFKDFGGVIDFKIFNFINPTSELDAHLITANKALELLALDNDIYFEKVARDLGTTREDYFKITFNPILPNNSTPITAEQFFGPYFKFKEQRPILRGQTGKPFQDITVFNDHYYYDENETEANVVSVIISDNSDFVTQGYTDAFLKPPHSFGLRGMTNFELGQFFLAFNNLLFTDINEIVIYSWQTDCSNYFDAGKEWWGSFFWTVYNPAKNWYIAITASTTD